VSWFAVDGDEEEGAMVLSRWPPLPALLRYRLAMARARGDDRQSAAAYQLNDATVRLALRRNPPDLINLHNLHSSLLFSSVERMPRDRPYVWTLHDMWPLTGYCSYSYECVLYRRGCRDECPELGRWEKGHPLPAGEWRRRERFFTGLQDRLAWVSPSKWLLGKVGERFPDPFRMEHIPYGVPLDTFRPVADRAAVRRALGLPVDVPLILTVCHRLGDQRKGLPMLVEAAVLLAKTLARPPLVLAVGGEPGQVIPEGWEVRGRTADEAMLNLYYNAADVFVLPTRADNLPNTLLESVAAGTPAVTFPVGGCPEIVRDGVTGRLASTPDAAGLAQAIQAVLDLPAASRGALRDSCRRIATQEYAESLQAERYRRLFEDVQENWSRHHDVRGARTGGSRK
jgi:glycosyltransferase involved in cell wall biosynthesis